MESRILESLVLALFLATLSVGCATAYNKIDDFNRITGQRQQCDFYIEVVCIENRIQLDRKIFALLIDDMVKKNILEFPAVKISSLEPDKLVVYAGEFNNDSGVVQKVLFDITFAGDFLLRDSQIRIYDPP